MKVGAICTRPVHSIGPADTVGHAALLMAENDVGGLPVVADGKLVGIVTDRDLVLRGLAAGMSLHAPVRRVMTIDVVSCSPGDELNDALDIMSTRQIRRVPVCANSGELIGMIALADAARIASLRSDVADALADICWSAEQPCLPAMFA